MQANIGLMQAADSELGSPCPLCNAPLTQTSSTGMTKMNRGDGGDVGVKCSSCGFTGPLVYRQHAAPSVVKRQSSGSSVWIDPAVSAFLVDAQVGHAPKGPSNSVTPVPRRASAQHTGTVKVRPRYIRSQVIHQESDITDEPTLPSPSICQYKSPDYEVENSLSVFSLVFDVPTQPEAVLPAKVTKRLPDIDEVDTVSSVEAALSPSIGEPPLHLQALNSMVSSTVLSGKHNSVEQGVVQPAVVMREPTSWTAGGATQSRYAQLLVDGSKKSKSALALNPLDRLRWWLLRPSRIEFILWLGGTVLLMTVTCVLLLVTAFSMEWITPGFQTGTVSSLINTSNASTNSSGGLTLSLLDKGPILPGQSLHLHGKGFSAHRQIVFSYDNERSFLVQNTQSHAVQADGVGAFTVTLTSPSWSSGRHVIVARDVATHHMAALLITLVAGPFGKSVTVTATSGTPMPSVTATATSSGSGSLFPPIDQQPVPITPTVIIKPTATGVSVKPTVGITPTVQAPVKPTVGITPTAKSSADGTPAIGNTSLRGVGAQFLAFPDFSVHLEPWMWILILGYGLAMVMLGVAGLLYRR